MKEELENKIKESWEQSEITPHADLQKETSWKKFQAEKFPQKKSTWLPYGIAASFLVIIAITSGLLFQKSDLFTAHPAVSETIIENPTSQLKTIYLPDSSKVELAAHAKLSFLSDFKTNRNVELNGEAVFEVQKDAAHPFQVKSQKTTTTVLGTIFKVNNLSAKHTEVTLYEGSIQLQVEGYSKNWIIAPGEAFVLKDNQIAINTFNRFKEFKEAPLKDFVTYIEKNYGYQLLFQENISDKKITLKLNQREKLAHILEIIAKLYRVNYHQNQTDQKIYFTPKN